MLDLRFSFLLLLLFSLHDSNAQEFCSDPLCSSCDDPTNTCCSSLAYYETMSACGPSSNTGVVYESPTAPFLLQKGETKDQNRKSSFPNCFSNEDGSPFPFFIPPVIVSLSESSEFFCMETQTGKKEQFFTDQRSENKFGNTEMGPTKSLKNGSDGSKYLVKQKTSKFSHLIRSDAEWTNSDSICLMGNGLMTIDFVAGTFSRKGGKLSNLN